MPRRMAPPVMTNRVVAAPDSAAFARDSLVDETRQRAEECQAQKERLQQAVVDLATEAGRQGPAQAVAALRDR